VRNPIRWVIGKARDLRDPGVFHQMSLVAFLAWVGLGADGLSSSAYGPAEAFKALGHWDELAAGACAKEAAAELAKQCVFRADHAYLAVFIAGAIAATVFIISWSYRRIIEEFPHGGGGYIVATKHLGPYVGVVSGCALLVDYVLTIAVSLASGYDAVFSLPWVPAWLLDYKVEIVIVVLGLMTLMNLRGVKESVTVLTPIFLTFLVTHAILIFGAIGGNLGRIAEVGSQVSSEAHSHISTAGLLGVALVFMRAFSLGGGTFTGIEAVSNGLAIMREPRVRTAKRTMLLMATSLAITASGILLAYLLVPGVMPTPFDKVTMNASLASHFAGDSVLATVFVGLTLVSEGALLFVAAQAGFVDGPRVMANMALDQWMPHRMAALSERLTMRNGVYLMAAAAALVVIYTGGSVDALVVMYSINVFITFTLSNIAMVRHAAHTKQGRWQRAIFVHGLAAAVCAMILVVTLVEKFTEGGWLTTVITAALCVVCFAIRRHYQLVGRKVVQLSKELELELPPPSGVIPDAPPELDPAKPTAVVLAGGFGGLGLHTLLQIPRVFPGQFSQVVFVAAGVIDAGVFKGKDEIDTMRGKIDGDLEKYVAYARTHLGWAADCDSSIGTEAVSELDHLCREVALRFPRSVFFAGKLIFQQESWYQRILHNETAAAVERRLQFAGLPMIVMPIRMFH
jgi:amino acid transporter